MAFNSSMTSQNQQSPTDNINTRGIQLYNGDATIVLDYWNGLATVKIHPALPESERQNKQVYDYKKSVSVTLTPENAVLLGKYIREDITPALAKGEECTRAIISARVNMIVVSTGVGEHGEVKPYVAVYRKINETEFLRKQWRSSWINIQWLLNSILPQVISLLTKHILKSMY